MEPRTPTSDAPAVVVHGEGVTAQRAWADVPAAEVRSRYGGTDLLASLGGALAGVGTLVALGTLAATGLTLGFQQGLRDRDALSLGGLLAGLVVLALSGLVAGWVAGRASRYDGVRNGLVTGVLLLLLTAGLSAAAASQGDDVASALHVPSWVSDGATSTRALVTGLVAAAVTLVAAALGGLVGRRWHRRADDLLLHTRAGGLPPYPSDVR